MKCENIQQNLKHCNCSYEPCSRKGNCCACLKYHLDMNELPACCFPDDVEKSYDRSFKRFVEIHK
ncbi:cytosolic protein [Candidatus Woesearchaeota archaeon]|nr:cytosolic protein [Candidatus Woesearchaeota archaeon]